MPQVTNTTPTLDAHPSAHNVVHDVVAMYGADKTGATDSTTAIGNAVSAAAEGDVILFPPGHFVYSTLSVTKTVTFRGSGYWNNSVTAFGNAQWNGSNYGTNFGGTVLRSTNTTTRGILAATSGKRLHLRDLMILGPGSGTSNGVECGTAAIAQTNMHWSNVLVANFGGAGYRFLFALSNAFYNVRAIGCKTGFNLTDTCNDNEFYRLVVEVSDTDAFKTDAASARISVYGGLIQSCTGDGFDLRGTGHHIQGVYFENPGITYAVNLSYPNGSRHTVNECYMSTADEDIYVGQDQCMIGPLRHGGGGYNLELGVPGSTFIYPAGATIIDGGQLYTGLSGSAPTTSVGAAKTRVMTTASLPAGNAAWDGFMVLEEVGAGDRNLIIYAGGQRFRIDGGAAF